MRHTLAALVLVLFLLFVSSFSVSRALGETPSVNSTQPTKIMLWAQRSNVLADGYDTINIAAHVYDSRGNPVADGTEIDFAIGNLTSNSYAGGFTWSIDNGSFSAAPGSGTFTSMTGGGTGSTNAVFGWVPEGFVGNNSTIWAYVNGTSIYSGIKIYFSSPTASWVGYLVDQFGHGYGDVPVTMHVIGYDGNATYEIYNVTHITSNTSPTVGQFYFDYVRLDSGEKSIPYSYVDARVNLPDNRTVYGRSKNSSMSREYIPDSSIILWIATPTPTITPTSIPSATPEAGKGLAEEMAIMMLAILIAAGGAYYLSRKK